MKRGSINSSAVTAGSEMVRDIEDRGFPQGHLVLARLAAAGDQ